MSLPVLALLLSAVVGTSGPAPTGPVWTLDLAALGASAPRDLWVAGSAVLVQGADHGVTALDAGRGELLWVSRLGAPLDGAPVTGGGAVVLSAGRELLVVDERTGRQRLRGRLVSALGATPVADEQLVYVPLLVDDSLLALEPTRGLAAWRYRHPGGYVGRAHLVGQDDQRLIVVAALDGTLRALPAGPNLPDAERWVLTTGPTLGELGQRGDQLLLGAVGGVVARVDGRSGRFHWRRLLGEALTGPPVSGGGLTLAVTGTRLVALAWDDGRVLWEHEPAGRPVGATDDVVVLHDERGTVTILRAADGTRLGQLEQSVSALAVAGDMLVTLAGGRVSAWHGADLFR